MSNNDPAGQLRELTRSYVNRAIALARELEFLARGSTGFLQSGSGPRREELRNTLMSMPQELVRVAAAVLESDASDARHLPALRRAAKDRNLESVVREVERIAATIAAASSASDPPIETLVTLEQVAPLAHLSKRTLERYLADQELPQPDYPGGDGKAHRWVWRTLRPALEKVCDRILPERFPGSRII